MKFNSYLTEIFDTKSSNIKLRKTKHPDSEYSLEYQTDKTSYVFTSFHSSKKNGWIVGFDRLSIDPDDEPDESKDISVQAFTGFIKALNQLIKDKKIDRFTFNTSEKKLKNLYTKWVKYIERETKFKLTDTNDLGFVIGWTYTK